MALNFEADSVPFELLPKPLGWRVLIAPVKLRDTTEGGIALPQHSLAAADHFRNIAKVLAVGSSAYDDPSFRGGRDGDAQPWCKAGDVIVYGCHDGERLTVTYNGETHSLRFIKDANVVSVITDTSIIEALL
jgi:co-chaperonin GroES (HSP10)